MVQVGTLATGKIINSKVPQHTKNVKEKTENKFLNNKKHLSRAIFKSLDTWKGGREDILRPNK